MTGSSKLRVLVTGAGGFLGSYLASSLSEHGHEVIALFRKLPRQKNFFWLERDNVLPLEADICDSFDIDGPIDAVFHSAALSRPNQGGVDDYLRANVIGTRNVLESACRAGVEKIVNVSTISVYGEIRTTVLDENTDHINSDIYGQSKYLAENILSESPVPTLSLRLPGILGQHAADPWIARVAKKMRDNEDVRIFNGDKPFNSCVHVSDVLNVGMAFIQSKNEEGFVANLAASDPMALSEVLGTMRSGIGSSSKIIDVPANENRSYSISSDVVEKIYGKKPLSVKSTIQAYLNDMKSTR